jgi:hypothetical protein
MDVLLELLLVSEQYLYKYLIGRNLEARGDRTCNCLSLGTKISSLEKVGLRKITLYYESF